MLSSINIRIDTRLRLITLLTRVTYLYGDSRPNILKEKVVLLLLLLSTLPVRHWRVYTEGTAYTRWSGYTRDYK